MTNIYSNRNSLHLLKKVAQKYYATISNALNAGDIDRAKGELKNMMMDFDVAVLKLGKRKRKDD